MKPLRIINIINIYKLTKNKKVMKTRLFTKSAIIMATAFSLASCSQEEELVNPNTNPNTNTKTGRTVFAAGGPTENGTRTTMDKNRVYFWQYNDQIWVNDGGTWVKSSESQLAPDSKTANFYFDRVMTADSYEVLYTGFNSKDPTKVTIPATFSFVTSSGGDIGRRGDCGVATATRNPENGTYSFALLHKPAFLGIAPIQATYLNKRYAWTKIEITEVNGKPIAGTFAFSKDGMDANNVTSPSSTVTYTVNQDAEYPRLRLQNYRDNFSYIYQLIPPSNRQLMVKYYIVDDANPSEEIVITRRLNARNYIENNVVQFAHVLDVDYYSWDAPRAEPYDRLNLNPSTVEGAGVQATNVCATMPNFNEMTWYVLKGDPRWDNTTQWTADGGASYHTGGVWIKKKAFIEGFSSTEYVRNYSVYDQSDNYRYAGKPEDTSKYFFLPALGSKTNSDNIIGMETSGYYWSSTSSADGVGTSGTVVPTAIMLSFTDNSIGLANYRRAHGLIAGNGSMWFK